MRPPSPPSAAPDALLGAVAGALARAPDLATGLGRVTDAVVAGGAAWCAVAVAGPGDELSWSRSPGPDLAEEAEIAAWLGEGPEVAWSEHGRVRIPLRARGRLLGTLAVLHPAVALDEVADLCAPALDHAALIREAARAAIGSIALAAAEDAERRAAFINEVGTLLDASLDFETALTRLARVAVPGLADCCFIDVADGPGRYRRAAVAHTDREREPVGWELAERFPPDDRTATGPAWTLREGRPMLLGDISDGVYDEIARAPEEAALLRELGLRSLMTLPLRARGRVLGVVTLGSTRPDRRYSEVDLAHAVDIVTRAGLAIDNARLFTELARTTRAQEFLAEASKALFAVLDDRRSYQTLVSLVVPELADWAVVDIPSPGGGRLDPAAISAQDPDRREALTELRRRFPIEPSSPMVGRVLATGEPQLFAGAGDAEAVAAARNDEHLVLLRRLGGHTAMIVALTARGRTLATLTVGRTETEGDYDAKDLRLLEEVARRGAIAADNARLYQERAYIARTLQQSLLPPHVPDVQGLQVAARFRAAGDGFDVGGDFYDLFPTGSDTWTATIGDVCGKGPDAAALTALARYTLRAAALSEDAPRRILALLNDAILDQQRSAADFCSVALARFTLRPGGATVVLSSGGHPPALVLRVDGRVDTLEAPGALLGVVAGAPLSEASVELLSGDTLVLYTDGVVEARREGEQWGDGAFRDLLTRSAGLEVATIADRIERTVVEWQHGQPRDDIALLLLRVA